MNVLRRHVGLLGYKGAHPFESSYQAHWYKKIPELRRVICISNLCPQTISHFNLTKQQWRAFEKGTLALVPPGCVGGLTGAHQTITECTTVFSGDFENWKKVSKILDFCLLT